MEYIDTRPCPLPEFECQDCAEAILCYITSENDLATVKEASFTTKDAVGWDFQPKSYPCWIKVVTIEDGGDVTGHIESIEDAIKTAESYVEALKSVMKGEDDTTTVREVTFGMAWEEYGYQTIQLPPDIDIHDRDEVIHYIASVWDDIPLPGGDYVSGSDELDPESLITVWDGKTQFEL